MGIQGGCRVCGHNPREQRYTLWGELFKIISDEIRSLNLELFNSLTKLDNSDLIQRCFKSNLLLLFLREACPCTVHWATSTSTPMAVSTSPAATTSWVWISLIWVSLISSAEDAATRKLLCQCTRKGCYLEKMFCKQFSESSTCLPGQQDSCSTGWGRWSQTWVWLT